MKEDIKDNKKNKTTTIKMKELQVSKNKNSQGLHNVPIENKFLESPQPFSCTAQPLPKGSLYFFKLLQKPRDIVSCGLFGSPVVGVSQKLPDRWNSKEGWPSAKEGEMGEKGIGLKDWRQ